MAHIVRSLVVLGALASAACGGGASSEPPPATAAAPPAAVPPAGDAPAPPAASSVTGTFKGKPFASRGAITRKHDQLEGEYKLYVLEDGADCATFDGMDVKGLKEGVRFLAANITGGAGAKTELKDFNASFGTVGQAGSVGRVATSGGTIEIVNAPAPGHPGKIRVQATSNAGSLQGETPVTMCP